MRKIKQFLLFFLALLYSGFIWGQGNTTVTNFSDAPYGRSDFSFQSGGIDFNLSSWNMDSLSFVDPAKYSVSIKGGSLQGYFQTNNHINWVKIAYINYDSINGAEFQIYGVDSTIFMYSQSVGVADTFFYDTKNNQPFNGFDINGQDITITEIQYNWSRDFILEKDSLCPGEKLVADFNPDSTTNFVEWYLGDGTKIPNTFHVEYVYKSLGDYPLQCVVHNYDQSIDTITRMISVSNSVIPVVDFWARAGGMSCPGDPVSFGVNGHYSTYDWQFGDGTVSSDSFPNHVYSLSGTYTVILRASNACGNSDSSSIVISVNDSVPAYADFWIEPIDPCPFQDINFEAQNSGTFLWDFGDGSKGYMPKLLHSYKDTGSYTITLVNQNGCGNSDTTTQILNVNYHPNYPSNSDVQAGIKLEGGVEYVTVCTGTAVPFANYSYIEQGSKYYWDFGDSTPTSTVFEPVHVYTSPGYYSPRLVVTNNCGVLQEYYLSVDVSDTLMPNTMLMDLPNAICPGEKIYFWDDNFDKAKNYTYNISYGDSSSANNIVNLTTTKPHVLAEHVYSNLGNYPILFTATNQCNNQVVFTDTIHVLSDTTRIPFYRVESSAKDHNNGDVPQDWGRVQSTTDALFHVSVNWAQWDSTLNDNFYVAFWYGGVDLANPNLPPPDGFVKIKGLANVATAYIPFDNHYSTIGVAAFWSCSGIFEGNASAKGIPVDSMQVQIAAFPYTPKGVTNIPPINLGVWNGNCFPTYNELGGDWKSDTLSDGSSYVIHFFQQEGNYEMEKKFPDGKVDFLERGIYYSYDSLTEFYPDMNEQMNTCFDYGSYFGDILNGSLAFNKDSDLCSQRVSILDNRVFHKIKFSKDGVCPNDPVFLQAYGGQSYEWQSVQDTIFGQEATFSFPAIGNYTIDLLATNACGRTDSLFNYVNVVSNKPPDTWFKEDKQFTFTGDSIQFTYGNINNPATSTFSYEWMFGDGSSAYGAAVKHAFANPGNYDVILRVTNGCGTNEEHHNISILEKPICQANFNWNIGTGDTVMFTNNSVGTPTNYNWDFGDGISSTLVNPVHAYIDSGFFNVCLTIRDSINNCVNTSCQNIVLGKLDCFADFDYFINNQTDEVSFSDKSQGTNLSRHWDFGDGYFADIPNPVHIFSPGFYSVSLTVFNPTTGCQSTNAYDISVGQVDCHPEFSTYMDSLTVEFYDQSVGATGFYWDFGDGTTDSIPDPIHTYAQSGVYNVYYSIWNDTTQCFGDMTRDIQVVGDSANFCSVSFDSFVDSLNNASFNIVSNSTFTDYYWDFGDGNFDTTSSPSYNYANPGIYNVCLSVYDSISGCQADFCSDVPVQTSAVACKADFAVTKGAAQGEFNFIDKSIGSVTNWSWDFDDYSYSSKQNPVHTFAQADYYNVFLSIYDSISGCYSEIAKNIPVLFGDSTQVACKSDFSFFIDAANLSVAFQDKSLGNIDTRLWAFGDGKGGKGIAPTHVFPVEDVYNICLTVKDSIDNCVNTKCQDVFVGQVNCYADFSFFIDQQTGDVSFNDKSTGGVSQWHWDFGDGTYGDIQNPIHNYADGSYTVTLTVFNPIDSCQSTNEYNISVGHVQCVPEFTSYIDSLTVEFYDKSIGATEFYWDFGDGATDSAANPVHTYIESGVYNVYYSIWNDTTQCFGDMERDITVGTDSGYCDISFDFFVDSMNNATFNILSHSSFTNYYWDFGDGTSDSIVSPMHNYTNAGIYGVSLAAFDSVSGCQANDYVDVPVQTATQNCKADFAIRKGSTNGEFNFIDKSMGNLTNHSWSFGDDSSSVMTNPMHIYADNGYYTVVLAVMDTTSGCYDETSKDVPVYLDSTTVACKADFDFFIDAGAQNITLTDKSLGNIDTWYWTFGDGNYKSTQNTKHTYAYPGKYKVTQYVFNQASGCNDQKSVMVKVGKEDCNLTADIAFMVDSANIVLFKDKSIGKHNVSYWTFGDGSTEDTTQVAHQYAAAGYYMVTLSVIDDSTGCDDHTSAFVQVGENDCKADFEFNVDVDSLKVSYIDKSKSANFHYWDFGDGHYSEMANPTHHFRNPGKYLTGLVIGNESGICWDYADNKIQVGEVKCDADFTATVNPNTYQTKFTNGDQARSTNLYWQFGDGSTSTMPNPSYRYSYPGYYLTSLYTSNDANNCMDYQEQLILVGNAGDDCEADFFYQANASTREVQFSDKSKGSGLTYLWDFGDGSTSTEQNPTYTFTDPGYQYVCLTIVNDKQIPNMTCKDVQVGEGCLAQFDFVVDGLTVQFKDNSFGDATQWHWEFGDSTAIDSQSPTKTYDKVGDYLVFFGIKNASGCNNRIAQIVSVGNSSDTTYSVGFAYELDTTNSKPGGHPVVMYGSGKGDSPKAKWSFGDAQKRGYAVNSSTLRPTYTYADTGTYNVCLTISDPITGKTGTACHEIKVGTETSGTGVNDLSVYADMNIYPNPANSFTRLNYSLTKNMNVNISLYDVKGNRVKAILDRNRIAGSYSQDIKLTDLPNGSYFIEIRSDYGRISKKFVIQK